MYKNLKQPSFYLIAITLLLASAFTIASIASAQSGNINWNDWSFSYEAGADRSGLVLRDVSFEGKSIIKKVSFPVMRVRYDNDVCGPYADILSTFTFRPASQGAPDSACDDETLCERTFTQNGQEVLELGINSQIGEYQLYQSYYFTPDGKMDSRIFSRGLQCLIDHDHHAYWMFDFDIGDSGNEQVFVNGDILKTQEFNDRKGASEFWTVEDANTGDGILLRPSSDDGSFDSFSQWDVAVRQAKTAEMGRWTYGAYGEIGNLFNEGENIDGENVMLWYATHMRHLASEGPDLWHASGPNIEVLNVSNPNPTPSPPPPPAPIPNGNLLTNPNFSNGLSNWESCSSANGSTTITNASVDINNGGCLYQSVNATAGDTFQLNCDAYRNSSNWTSLYLSFANDYWSTLNSDNTAITSTVQNNYEVSLTAPANTRYGIVVLYSEDSSNFDDCVLINTGSTPVAPPSSDNLLSNSGFEAGLANWNSCANATNIASTSNGVSGSKAAQVNNAGCIYQERPIQAGARYTASCDALSNGAWTTILLTLMDSNYTSVSDNFVIVDNTSFQSKNVSLVAPATSKYGAVVLYSEGMGRFDNCTLVKAQ